MTDLFEHPPQEAILVWLEACRYQSAEDWPRAREAWVKLANMSTPVDRAIYLTLALEASEKS